MLQEWSSFKYEIAKLQSAISWQSAYTALKKVCEVSPEMYPALEELIDIKAVIIWATVCCETGFSKMKQAKGELQASVRTSNRNDPNLEP